MRLPRSLISAVLTIINAYDIIMELNCVLIKNKNVWRNTQEVEEAPLLRE